MLDNNRFFVLENDEKYYKLVNLTSGNSVETCFMTIDIVEDGLFIGGSANGMRIYNSNLEAISDYYDLITTCRVQQQMQN